MKETWLLGGESLCRLEDWAGFWFRKAMGAEAEMVVIEGIENPPDKSSARFYLVGKVRLNF